MKSYDDIYVKGCGSYSTKYMPMLGNREKLILKAKDCCHFYHKGNKDCDFYLNNDCISYYSPSEGSFVYNFITKTIVN
ncbi:MAG: hypothetical protein RR959_08315 [Erysipelotrichaceae bacterium]